MLLYYCQNCRETTTVEVGGIRATCVANNQSMDLHIDCFNSLVEWGVKFKDIEYITDLNCTDDEYRDFCDCSNCMDAIEW